MRSSIWLFVLFLVFIVGCLATTDSEQQSPRQQISLNDGWRFTLGDLTDSLDLSYNTIKAWILPTGNEFVKDNSNRANQPEENPGGNLSCVQPGFDDSEWESVDLPHDWAIGGPFTHEGGGGMGRLPTAGVGWYRNKISVSEDDLDGSVFLDIDGAMSYSTVWVNGELAGGWPYGYTSWRLDLTPYLQPGENQLAVRLDNPDNSSRWYPGAGIYRNVWLVKTSPVHVGHWGTFVRTVSASPEEAEIEIDVTIANDSDQIATPTISTKVYQLDQNGEKIVDDVSQTSPEELEVSAGSRAEVSSTITIPNPKLWGPKPGQQPNRYIAVTTVSLNDQVVDQYETTFGIGTIQFTGENGLLVNGQETEIKGVNMHHDLGPLGAAVNKRAIERQFQNLQEMGVNAIRTAHNPPSPEYLALADSMGILILDEAFDMWQMEKIPNDYHLLFDDWHEQDLRAFVRRDRNHPSVIMWSIGNEVIEQWQGGDESAAELARSLHKIVKEEDPTRPTTAAMNNADANGPFPAEVDVIGLNYQGTGVRDRGAKYPVFHENFPQKFVYGSETSAMFSSRGVYVFPVSSGKKGAPVGTGAGIDSLNRQVSSYGVNYADFGFTPDSEFESQEKWPYIGGRFVWAGWDYLGEPGPFDESRSSYFGIVDLAGFEKNRYYLYQSQWRPSLKMAHILPHWTWHAREGEVTPVHVYSSADEAELFLNGESLGRKQKGEYEYRFRWDNVRYEPGELKVITYKDGEEWATDIVHTANAPAKLDLIADRNKIRYDGKDLAFITLQILDINGHFVPNADRHIEFEISGPGEIVATANGDPTNFTSFHSHERETFNGLALVIVQALEGDNSQITVTATSDGLTSASVTINPIQE